MWRGAQRVGYPSPTLSQRFFTAGRGVSSSLMLHLRIDLSAQEDDNGGNPQPSHEADDRPKRTVRFVELAEVRCVPGEGSGNRDPEQSRDSASPGDPPPTRRLSAWAVAID